MILNYIHKYLTIKIKKKVKNYNLFKNIDKDEIKLNPGLFYILVDYKYLDQNE